MANYAAIHNMDFKMPLDTASMDAKLIKIAARLEQEGYCDLTYEMLYDLVVKNMAGQRS